MSIRLDSSSKEKVHTTQTSQEIHDRSQRADLMQIPFEDLNWLSDLMESLYMEQDQLQRDVEKVHLLQKGNYQRELAQSIKMLTKLEQKLNGESSLLRQLAEDIFSTTTSFEDELKKIQSYVLKIQEDTVQLQKSVSVVTERVIRLRKVPVKVLFQQVTSQLERWATETEKFIDVIWQGEELLFDKLLLDAITEPLIHLAQNSILHGIETEEARRQQQKSEQGTIYLSAFSEGDTLILTFEDDGKGIDRRALIERTLQDKILLPQQADQLSADDMLQLIYLPALSLADRPGMGLYKVRSQLAHRRVMLEVDSEVGAGTCFTLSVPSFSQTTTALLVCVASETVAIPAEFLLEVISVPKKSIQFVADREALNIEGQIIPLIRLREVWGFEPAPALLLTPIVLVGIGDKRTALAVDCWQEQRKMIIKSPLTFLEPLNIIAGFGMLAADQVVMLLDIPELIARCSIS